MKRATCLFALPLVAALAWANTALAQSDSDRQAAQALFDKADELMKRKDYAGACPKLEEVTRLVPDGLGAKLTLAECYEGAGKLASAWSTYSQVESLAARLNQPDRQTLARDRAAALKPRLAKMVIDVPPAVASLPGLAVKRDGKPVGAAQFGEAIPADIGDHTVEATADGKLPWSVSAKVDADGSSVTVEVQPLKDAPPGTQPGPPGKPAPEDEPKWLLPLGIAVGSVGVAGLIVGGVMGGLAMGEQSDAEELCPNGRCSAEGNDARTSAGTFADVSTAAFIAGGVLAAAGVVIIIVAPKGDSREQPAATAALQLGPGSIGIVGGF
jgi:hypothetical protein